VSATTGTVYLLHFDQPYKHARHYVGWTRRNVKRRLAEHAAGRGARLTAVVREAGIGWQLARLWPGSRARERQIKRQGGHARHCPLCGVKPRALPRNRDGSLSRSRTTDAQKAAAGVMTAAQLAEHTALRRGAVTGKPARPADRGPLADDPWAIHPAPSVPVEGVTPDEPVC
jgi:predicted GIY-YIG superfamily endonuclease